MGPQTICRTASKLATLRISAVKIFLLASPFPSTCLPLHAIALGGFRLLDVVCLDDGRDQPGEALVDFRAARRIAHLHALAFAANQASFAQRLEVL